MKINKNDPRLTAYLLNELSLAEHQLVEQAVKQSPELTAEVEILKKNLNILSSPLSKDEDLFRLTTSQREKIFSTISDSRPNWFQSFVKGPWGYGAVGLVTASFALMVFNHSLKDQALDAQPPSAEYRPAISAKTILEEREGSAKGTLRRIETHGGSMNNVVDTNSVAPQLGTQESKKKIVAEKAVESESFAKAEMTADLATASDSAADSENADFALQEAKPEAQEIAAAPDVAQAAKPAAPVQKEALAKKGFSAGTDSAPSSSSFGAGAFGTQSSAPAMALSRNYKMKKADSSGNQAESSTFIFEVNPALPIETHQKVQTVFEACLKNEKLNFAFSWDVQNGITQQQPEQTLNPSQKSCLQIALKKVLGSKTNLLLFKVQSVLK